MAKEKKKKSWVQRQKDKVARLKKAASGSRKEKTAGLNVAGKKPSSVVATKGGDYPVYPKKSQAAESFKSAFAKARKGGGKTFEWKGRSYSTKTADDVKKEKAAKAKKKAPKKVEKSIGQSYEVSPKGKTKEGASIYTKADYEAQTPEEKSKWKMEKGGKVECANEYGWPTKDARGRK